MQLPRNKEKKETKKDKSTYTPPSLKESFSEKQRKEAQRLDIVLASQRLPFPDQDTRTRALAARNTIERYGDLGGRNEIRPPYSTDIRKKESVERAEKQISEVLWSPSETLRQSTGSESYDDLAEKLGLESYEDSRTAVQNFVLSHSVEEVLERSGLPYQREASVPESEETQLVLTHPAQELLTSLDEHIKMGQALYGEASPWAQFTESVLALEQLSDREVYAGRFHARFESHYEPQQHDESPEDQKANILGAVASTLVNNINRGGNFTISLAGEEVPVSTPYAFSVDANGEMVPEVQASIRSSEDDASDQFVIEGIDTKNTIGVIQYQKVGREYGMDYFNSAEYLAQEYQDSNQMREGNELYRFRAYHFEDGTVVVKAMADHRVLDGVPLDAMMTSTKSDLEDADGFSNDAPPPILEKREDQTELEWLTSMLPDQNELRNLPEVHAPLTGVMPVESIFKARELLKEAAAAGRLVNERGELLTDEEIADLPGVGTLMSMMISEQMKRAAVDKGLVEDDASTSVLAAHSDLRDRLTVANTTGLDLPAVDSWMQVTEDGKLMVSDHFFGVTKEVKAAMQPGHERESTGNVRDAWALGHIPSVTASASTKSEELPEGFAAYAGEIMSSSINTRDVISGPALVYSEAENGPIQSSATTASRVVTVENNRYMVYETKTDDPKMTREVMGRALINMHRWNQEAERELDELSRQFRARSTPRDERQRR